MPATAKLPFGDSQASGLEELGGASPARINWLVDATGAMRLRPGCSTWSEFPSAPGSTAEVVGIYPWNNVLVYVTSDRYIWALTSSGHVDALSSSDAATQLAGSLRPTFFNGRSQGADTLILAGGGAVQKWTGAGLSARLGATTVGAAAQPATHVVGIADRMLADVYGPTGDLQYSGFTNGGTDFEQWDSGLQEAGEFEAEADPDPVNAVRTNLREVFAFGTRTTQVYTPDDPPRNFSLARTLGLGCAAPYSIIALDDQFAWLDNLRRFVISNGRTQEAISAPAMSKTVEDLTSISDCWGFRSRIGPFDLLVWLFPTDHRGFCYDLASKSWSEWRTFDLTASDWVTPYIRAYAYWPERNVHVVGLADGTLAKLDLDAANVISPQVTELAYRDDLGAYQPSLRFSLGDPGDYEPIQEARSQGLYRQRQWRLSTFGSAEGSNPIQATVTTGFVDHESSMRKHCQRVTLQMRRGGTASPVLATVAETFETLET